MADHDPENLSLSSDDADLEHLRDACREYGEIDVGAAYREVQSRLAREGARPLRRLREASTRWRLALAVALSAVPALLCASLWLRPDIAAYPGSHMAVALLVMAALTGLALWVALRPVCVAPLPPPTDALLFGGALASLGGVYLWSAARAAPLPEVARALAHAAPCLLTGLLIALPIYALLRLLDRGDTPHTAMLALAAGLAGNLVLQLHCPSVESVHLLGGHLGALALFVAFYALARRRSELGSD